jgi:KUP system potassium uptake protein
MGRWSCRCSFLLLIVDGSLFSANMMKFVEGGWVPLAIATVLFIGMWTWYRGRHAVAQREHEQAVPIDTLLATIEPNSLARPQGTAIYLTTFSDSASSSLMQNLRHNGVLHEHVVLLTVHLLDEPFVSPGGSHQGCASWARHSPSRCCATASWRSPTVGTTSPGWRARASRSIPVHTSFFHRPQTTS